MLKVVTSARTFFVVLFAVSAVSRASLDHQVLHPSTSDLSTNFDLHRLLYTEVNSHLSSLGKISDDAGSLVRTFLSPAHQKAQTQIATWMQEAGMHTWTDAVANVHGRIKGQNATAPALVIGSHYDTVKDAGKFDGALGILVGIAAVKALVIQKAIGAGLLTSQQAGSVAAGAASVPELLAGSDVDNLFSSPVEVVAFCDEEGLRFQTTFLGSRALVGTLLQPTNLLQSKGADGLSVTQVLQQHGYGPTHEAISSIAMRPNQVRGYVEVHQEQGPVLEAADKPLGVVSAIAGQTRLSVSMIGTQGHAGTVPMAIRRDPLAAAAEAIYTIEQQCRGGRLGDTEQALLKGKGSAQFALDPSVDPRVSPSLDPSLVCTVGAISVWPGASNVIPGSTNFTVDIRAQNDAFRNDVVETVMSSIDRICTRRKLACLVERVHDAGAVQCSPALVQALTEAVRVSEQGSSPFKCTRNDGHAESCTPLAAAAEQCESLDPGQTETSGIVQHDETPVLVSGAGHDALAMADLTEIGMLFVRCRGGISHSPLESVSEADVGRAATALFTYLAGEL